MVSVWAVITKYDRQRAYKQQKRTAYGSESWKVQDQSPTWSPSGEDPLFGAELETFPYVLTWRKR